MASEKEWYQIDNVEELDTPALVIYKDRVKQNIDTLIDSIDDIDRLRPHVKTHKSQQVCELMLNAGIKKFKCATIAEAEMLALAGALAAAKTVPPSEGTLPTHTPLFVAVLIGTVITVGALTFVPALALGPVAEHLQLFAGK